MLKGYVRKILPFSSVDGPGNRTAIFLQGCNFDCAYCHNPETIEISRDPQQEMTVEEIITTIKKTRSFITGITVSGGECTLQYQFLMELFKEVRKLDLSIFIDTNGSVPLWDKPEFVASFDQAMLDVKAFDLEAHKGLTGLGNETVLKNLVFLAENRKLYEVRTVVVDGFLDNVGTVDATSKLVAQYDPNVIYKLIKYRPLGVRKGLVKGKTPSPDLMNQLAEVVKGNGLKNVVIV